MQVTVEIPQRVASFLLLEPQSGWRTISDKFGLPEKLSRYYAKIWKSRVLDCPVVESEIEDISLTSYTDLLNTNTHLNQRLKEEINGPKD